MIHSKRYSLCLAAGGVLMLLTACQPQTGPLEYGRTDGGRTGVCAPGLESPWLVGDSFQTRDDTIKIGSIELVNPHGIELVDSWLTTLSGAIGVVDYPPTIDVDWDHAIPAEGSEVPPDTLQAFAVEVQGTGGKEGHADAIAINYSIDGHEYQVVGTHSITVARICSGGE